METRSRKRAQASEQRPSPTRAKKKPNISSPSLSPVASASAADTHRRYPSRRAGHHTTSRNHNTDKKNMAPSTATAATATPMPPTIVSTRPGKNRGTSEPPIKETNVEAHQNTSQRHQKALQSIPELDKEAHQHTTTCQGREKEGKYVGKGKEKEKQSVVIDKGKEKEKESHRDDANLQNSHLNNKINKTQDDTYHRIIKGAYNARSNDILMQILSNLASGDEVWQLDGLTQLCELLSMGTEDSLACFPTCSFVTELVGFLNPSRLNPQYNPELILLAARALTHLCDALPSSCSLLVNQGAIPYFCGFLLSIQYIDLAEQSLQALAKISREHPAPCLRAGALTAVLSNFEFYSTGVQRVAVSTAANMCRHMPSDASDFVTEAVPILTNLLQYTDAKVVEHASVCLTRIAESFASSSEKLDMLCSHGLVPEAARLISVDSIRGDMVSQTSLSNSTYTGLVRLLSICAGGSAVAAETLLHMNISSILKDILAGSGQTSSKSISPLAMNMPREQLREIVNLVNDLLPSIPHSLVPASYIMYPQSAKLRGSNVVARKQPLCDQPNLLIQFGADLFPVLVQVYGNSVNPTIRYTCLDAIHKLVHFSTADMLRPIFQELNISSFLAGVLASKDPIIQITALQIADLLMRKLRDYFAKMFVKEGVLHAINSQFHLDLDNSSSSQRGTVVKSPSADRSRRTSRRGSSASNKDMVSEAVKEASFSPDGPLIKSGSAAVPLEQSRNDLPSLAISTAKMFKDAYFPMNSGNAMTENLKKLKKLCSKLSGDTKSKGKNIAAPLTSDQIMAQTITEILTELGRGDGFSTFEFVGCGIVEALLNYFSCGNLSKERLSHAKLRQKAFKRLHQFFAIARSCNNEPAEPLLTMIVRKLQSALASLERFPVNLTHLPSGTSKAGRAAGLSALAQPLKLQISRVQTERGLRDFPSTVVLVSPLTTLSSVEEFLWPRVRRANASLTPPSLPTSAPAAVDRRPLTRSNLSAPVASERPVGTSKVVDTGTDEASKPKGKGKVGSQNQIEEQRGPETRNTAARRRNAVAASATLKQSEAPTGIEDEEDELSFVQGEDTYATDEDDYYSDEDIEEHGQARLIFEEEPTLCDGVYEVWLGDDMDARQGTSATGERSVKRATTGSTSACGKGASEAGREYQVMVPGASSLSSPTRLCFSLGGKPLDTSWTILKAIQHQTVVCEEDEETFTVPHHESRRLWDEVHILNYQQADSVMEMGCTHPSGSSLSPTERGNKPATIDIVSQQTSLLDSVLHKRLPCDMDKSSPTYNILLLLYILDGLNRLAPLLHVQENLDAFAEGKVGHERTVLGPLIPQEEFLSSKLIPKMVCQMQDAMALCSGNLPTWCHQLTRACPFLFTFETKRQYFYLTALGLPRAFHRLQQQQIADNMTSSNNREPRVGRLRRRKVRILRDRIFDSATKVMELFSADKGVLEVEYFGEVGTGLGPTLEFYTLLSHELQKVSLGMWRSSSITERMDDDKMVDDVQDSGSSRSSSGPEDFVYAPYGLFPHPWKPNSENYATVINYFRLLGQVMGKALQDGRLLDLPLSTPFYKLVLEQELDLYDIRSIDLELGRTLEEMQNLVCKKQYLKSLKPSAKESRQGLGFHNARVEDLCLEFTLPGYPGYPLKPGGENIMVDMENLEEYIALIVDASVKTGIAPQMEAFRAGFNQIFPISALQIFNEEELSYMLCGHREMWLPDTLVEHMRFDHGYNASSPPIRNLLEIMGEFSPEQQRAFLQFVTGSPQLPCGGLSALRPKLTIVRKHPSGASGGTSPGTYATLVDGDLPSVMTCANYLKLPPYSCKEVMWERLLYAIHEGQGSFDLS